MLDMALREFDYFMIGDKVKVTYTKVRKGNVMNITVEAPKCVRIQRQSLFEEEARQKAQGQNPPPRPIVDYNEAQKISSINLTLLPGEYFMVDGRVKVIFKEVMKDGVMFVGVDAPMDVAVMRWTLYEAYVAKKADEGDPKYVVLNARLQHEAAERKVKYNRRKGSRQEMARRIAAGEIKASTGWKHQSTPQPTP